MALDGEKVLPLEDQHKVDDDVREFITNQKEMNEKLLSLLSKLDEKVKGAGVKRKADEDAREEPVPKHSAHPDDEIEIHVSDKDRLGLKSDRPTTEDDEEEEDPWLYYHLDDNTNTASNNQKGEGPGVGDILMSTYRAHSISRSWTNRKKA